MPFTKFIGVFSPDDLTIMRTVFDRLCEERHLSEEDSYQREALASTIVRIYQDGRTSEADLWQSLSKRRST